MIDETFLTTEEVLEYLQVNLRTVYRLIKAGKIPAVRVGRQWRFRKRDIDAWLDSQRPRGGRQGTGRITLRLRVSAFGRDERFVFLALLVDVGRFVHRRSSDLAREPQTLCPLLLHRCREAGRHHE